MSCSAVLFLPVIEIDGREVSALLSTHIHSQICNHEASTALKVPWGVGVWMVLFFPFTQVNSNHILCVFCGMVTREQSVMGAQLFRHPAVLVFQALCFSNPHACGHLAERGGQIRLCMRELTLDTAHLLVLMVASGLSYGSSL